MLEFCKGTEEDYEDMIDFANYIFSQAYEPHNFKQLMPKIYKGHAENATYHYLVKEDNHIKAMLCAYPIELNVNGNRLEGRGIGTVAVHPEVRKKGYMKILMNLALEDMKKDHIALSMLGGQRQRYEYFGFEPSGIEVCFSITRNNIYHKYDEVNIENIELVEINVGEEGIINELYELYKTQIVYGIRNRKLFYDICTSWNSQLYAVIERKVVVGYVIINGSHIHEWVIKESYLLPSVLKALILKLDRQEIDITLPLYERNQFKQLEDICEDYHIKTNKSICIFDYIQVIEVFMKLKMSYNQLTDGMLKMEIEEYGKIRICIENNKLHVTPCEGEVDIRMKQLKAISWLFSPLRIFDEEEKSIPLCTQNWFPLPMYLPIIDSV